MNRRSFLFSMGVVGASGTTLFASDKMHIAKKLKKRIGIIGLDTSHAVAFTKALYQDKEGIFKGYKVVVAYPFGNPTIANNGERITRFKEEIQQFGVEIVDSIEHLLKVVDYVMLETNDGNMHLEQAKLVIKQGKPLFIDKPIANSQQDAEEIFRLASRYRVPLFSTSSLRYIEGITGINKAEVMGADVYTPAPIEPNHKDLYWYGIHGVEMLFTILQEHCTAVQTIEEKDCDIIVGTWSGGRVGTLRAFTKEDHGFGGTVFTKSQGAVALGEFKGYKRLLQEIMLFFETGVSPVPQEQTIGICKFIDAAYASKKNKGVKIFLK
ncbi:gfo/Idh/MocA family oxidoreductase [Sphingobacterium alkalisoli]|uniref:Gfo/Idh/MocA family oxidoreductase n=1 Tax=Sphingobacterium alkalisoli TaxID=1874115 RepID=A0A4U0GR85_9SPHI|nr:Gfo/Idh/MocA family oxidoreductase [Sphingobacterium alkalisoli]TJY61455.1 gfo/Idh/MocA family oxidoreductase [Sphingobacterium alkalisoli]